MGREDGSFGDFLNKFPPPKRVRRNFCLHHFQGKKWLVSVSSNRVFFLVSFEGQSMIELDISWACHLGGSKLLKFVGGCSLFEVECFWGRKKDDCSSMVVVVHIFQTSILRKIS